MAVPPSLPSKPGADAAVSLEYPLVPSDIEDKYSFNAELPPYMKELPKAKLEQFFKDPELMRGYLLDRYGAHYKEMQDDLASVLKKQQEYTNGSIDQLDSHSRIECINDQLTKYHQLLDEFNGLQVEMFAKLSKVSKTSLVDAVAADLHNQESLCNQLVDQAMGNDGELTQDQLDSFIEQYKTERQAYYLKQEKLCRLREERVADLN